MTDGEFFNEENMMVDFSTSILLFKEVNTSGVEIATAGATVTEDAEVVVGISVRFQSTSME